MNATSIRTGTPRAGTITVTLGAAAYGFAYHRGTGKARHDLTVYPSGGNLAVGPLGEAVSDLAVRTAEALDDGPHEWTVTIDATGYTVRASKAAIDASEAAHRADAALAEYRKAVGCAMTDDRRERTAAALEDFRRVEGPPALTPTARAMLDDTIADLAVLLTGRTEAPECLAPVYSLTADGGSLRLEINWTFDPAGLNRFAAALKEDDRG